MRDNNTDYSILLGQAFKNWRNYFAYLSIQNIHDLNQARKAKGPHNSQVNLLEKGVLDPKKQFWYSLEEMMNIIENEEKFLYIKNITLRERLIKAKPFLTHDGRVANRGDFALMFLGMQPIRKEYLVAKKAIKITEEVATNISDFDRLVFNGFGTDELLDKKEAWSSLKPYLEKILDDKSLRKMQSVCAGQDDWTVKEINDFTKNGTSDSCVVAEALEEWTGKEMPDIHSVCQKGSKMKWPLLAV
tara:strand:+ start:363 stop:1097 length:735 start_codon:yes stop_codon:yes gene_type:complete